jgi:hypothetical protein
VKPWSPFDVPYDLHTNRELEFMLARGKPLAHFYDTYPPEPDEEVIPRSAFAAHVANGTFETCEFVELLEAQLPHAPQVRGTIHVLYARKSELWRIDAYIRMKAEGDKKGWSERLERLQGKLLGYSDLENDAHIEHLLSSPHAGDFPWLRPLVQERAKCLRQV